MGPCKSSKIKCMTVTNSVAADGIPARYSLAILAFFGFVFNYMLRINISIAIVAMVNQTAILEHTIVEVKTPALTELNEYDCGPHRQQHSGRLQQLLEANFNSSTSLNLRPESRSKTNSNEDGEFVWNEEVQAIIIGSFFWGYILTQLPGGRLAELFGAKYIFGFSILLAGVANILIPFAAANDPTYIIALRILLGIFEGGTYPAMHAMLARWAPPDERSRLSAIIYSGAQAGTIIAFPLAGYLIHFWGWPSVFFVMGSGSFVWAIIWMIFAHNSPEDHPKISEKEKELFKDHSVSNGKRSANEKVPWNEIFTSAPFWAIVVCSICSEWGFWTFLQELPTYLKNILGFDIKQNSLLSALPYAVMWMFGLAYSVAADRVRLRFGFTTGCIRKFSSFVCLVLPGICILLVTFVGCDPVATIVLLTIAIGFCGAKYSAYMSNHIDIAPNFAGTLLGVTNAFATIPGWLAPLVAGYLISGQQTLERWHIIFYIATVIYIFGFIVYVIFASGEVQPWNEIKLSIDTTAADEDSQSHGKETKDCSVDLALKSS